MSIKSRADCANCRNARAMKRMPYCAVPRDSRLLLLVQHEGGGWRTKDGEDVSMCKEYDPKKKEKNELGMLEQCVLPGVPTAHAEHV